MRRKSTLSGTKDAKRKKLYIAKLNELPRPEDSNPLSPEELQKEREINEAIYAEFMAKNEERRLKRQEPPPKPKLRIQPQRNNVHETSLESSSETPPHQDYSNFVEPQPLLMPIRSRPTNILVKEARRSLKAELLVERRIRAELRAERKRAMQLEQSLPEDNKPENEIKEELVQEQGLKVSVKTEPIM